MNSVHLLTAAAFALAALTAQAGDAAYECGGVGQVDAERIKAEAAKHHALLTFADRGGAYVADVDVRVIDSRGGEVLRAQCDGPLMLLDLPAPGKYRVVATVDGVQREQALTIGKGTVRAVFVWAVGDKR
jgi:hypothetical protein